MVLDDNLFSKVRDAADEARHSIGADVVYYDALFQSLQLQDFGSQHYAENDALLRTSSLEGMLLAGTRRRCSKRLRGKEMDSFLEGNPNAPAIKDLLANGMRDFMRPTYTPNGAKETQVGGSYLKYRPLCNAALLTLVEEGRAIAFSRDALAESDQLRGIQVSPLVWAPKAGSVKGRTCVNLSKRSRHHASVNESVDVEASDSYYLKPHLPLLPDVAEMACRQKELSGGEALAGATVDVSSAYHQFAQSPTTAKYQATIIKVPAPAGSVREWVMLVIIYLVGVFGFITASNVYCTLGQAIEFRHNRDEATPRSLTYIDDGILISPKSKIDSSVAEYIEGVEAMFGKEGVNHKKVKKWLGKLEAIGWEFDFVKWTVQPKQRGIAKMMHYLFNVLPIGASAVHEKDFESIVGC
jgi:hypothetical protein